MNSEIIENPLNFIKSLTKKRIRDEANLFVVEGYRFASEIPKEFNIVLYVCTDAFVQKYQGFKFREKVDRVVCSEKKFKSLSDTVTPQGIIAVCERPKHDMRAILASGTGGTTIIVLDCIRDPGNLGTIIRTADAADAKAVFITENSVDLYNPKVLRSTMGSVFNLPIFCGISTEEILDALKKSNYTIIGTSLETSKLYYDESYLGDVAIIIGSEAYGISSEARASCDSIVKIPICGKAESLNAGVAASIVMYEAVRQRKMKK